MIDEYKSQKVKASSSFKIVSYQFGIVLINWSINLQFALKDTFITNDENIGNHKYIGTSILQIYRIYRLIFWKKISISLKLLKTHENVRKTS